MGRPKQLLPYNNQTLLQHAVQTALASLARPVVVVVGAEAEAVQKGIPEKEVHIVVNAEWSEGMASSIRCGIKAFAAVSPDADGAILMVCDQPFVKTSLLNDLITAHQKTGKGMVACSYGNTFGPPVFFHSSLFPELLQLKGDVGARSIIRAHSDAVEAIPFPEGMFDIDTEADFEKIKGEREP